MAKTSFTLGLIGGIIGFFAAITALAVGGIGTAFNASGAETITILGAFAIIFSIIGIVFSVVSNKKPKIGGWLMIISGIAILICISLFGLLPAILLILGGIVALTKEKDNK